MRNNVVIITGPGIYGDLDLLGDRVPDAPCVAHHKIAALQQSHDVTVITTCRDNLHEMADIRSVIHLIGADAAAVALARDVLDAAQVVTLLGAQSTDEPLRSLMDHVPATSRLYVCAFNPGEGRLPRLQNLLQAHCAYCRDLPNSSIDCMLDDFDRFQ